MQESINPQRSGAEQLEGTSFSSLQAFMLEGRLLLRMRADLV
jgi:hypothetical protein